MKRYILFFTLIALTVWQTFGAELGLSDNEKNSATNEWGPVNYYTQISIGINGAKTTFGTNEDVEMLVRVRNLSTNNDYGLYVQEPFTFSDGFKFVVISPTGKDISPPFHKSFRFTGGVVWVKTNQVDGFRVDLGQICKLNEVGSYKIVLKMKRWSPDRKTAYEIDSNPLNIVVTP